MLNITVTLESSGLDAIVAGLAQSQGASPPGPIRDMYMQWGRRAQGFNEERFDRSSIGGGDWAPLALSTIRARRKGQTHNLGKRPETAKLLNRAYAGRGNGFGGFGIGARASLARDTKRGGALVSAGRTVSILKDTGILRAALKIGAAGSTFEMIPSGMTYGVAGNAPHPPKQGGGASGAVSAAASLLVRSGKPVGRSIPKSKRSGGGSRSAPTIGQIAGFHQAGGGRLPKREVIVVPDQTTVDAMAGDAISAVLKLAG